MFTILYLSTCPRKDIQIASTAHHHQQHYNEHCHAFPLIDLLEFYGTNTQENI